MFLRSVACRITTRLSSSPSVAPRLTRTMAGSYTYEWPRPAVTVDAILVTMSTPHQVLLIQRLNDPYANSWALPGGFVDENEPLDKAALRELQEETSVDLEKAQPGFKLIQVGAFGDPGRDPRGWCVGVGYAALVASDDLGVKAADDAAAAQWWGIEKVPVPLAFDHNAILRTSFERLAEQEDAHSVAGLRDALLRAAKRLS